MSSSYIFRLPENASEDSVKDAISKFESHGGKVTHKHTLFKGFSGTIPDSKVSVFEADPAIEAVEKDQKVSIN